MLIYLVSLIVIFDMTGRTLLYIYVCILCTFLMTLVLISIHVLDVWHVHKCEIVAYT